MKHHKYYKCVFINPPNNYLRSYDSKKKRKRVRVLSANTKNIAHDDKKYFNEFKNEDDLALQLDDFLNMNQ